MVTIVLVLAVLALIFAICSVIPNTSGFPWLNSAVILLAFCFLMLLLGHGAHLAF